MGDLGLILQFGWRYLPRYWTRLLAAILLSLGFGLSNASFVWASRTLTERFQSTPPLPGEPAAALATAAPADPGTDPWAAVRRAARDLRERAARVVEPWLPRVGQPLDWRQIVGALFFLPLLVGIRGMTDYLSTYCMGWVGERVIRDLRLDLMEKLSTLSLDYFNRSTTGDLLTRINVDTQSLLRALRVGGADLVKESITVLAVFGGLCLLDWKLTLCAMVVLPVCVFPLTVLGKKARRATKASLAANVTQSSQLVELLGGIRVIKAFNLEDTEIARFRETSQQLVHSGMKGVQAKELVNPIIEVVSMLGLGGLLLYVFESGRSGAELVAFLTGIFLFFVPIKKLAGAHILFQQAAVGTRRLIEVLNQTPTVTDPPHPRPLPPFGSALAFHEVSFAYADHPVLSDLRLTLPRGMRLGIAGESGSGKTTLVNLVFRFYDPTRGSITFDGIDLREVSARDLRQQMALVSQDVVLFDQTIAENIACGSPGASRDAIEAAARDANAHEFIGQLPQGYDTRVGERGVRLSGGQRQRIAIARAFIRNAPILVLDEATASLDSESEAEVQAAVDRLAEHRTVICVAHRLSTLASMDRVIVLSAGRIVEEGTFDELLARGGLFAAMARRQGIVASPAIAPDRR